MINLTNKQVIAFNRIFNLRQTILTHLTCKISTNTISIVIDDMKHKRFYWIRKSIIECKSYNVLNNERGVRISKLRKKYIYKLKKR